MWEAEFCKVCAQEGRKQVAHRSNPPLCRWHFYREHPELAPEEISPPPWERQEPGQSATTAVQSALKNLDRAGGKMATRKNVDREALKREYEAGATMDEIGLRHTISGSTVNYHLHKLGVKMRPPSRRPRNQDATPARTGKPSSHVKNLWASGGKNGRYAARNGAGGIEREIEALLDSKWNGFDLGEKLRALRAMETMKA